MFYAAQSAGQTLVFLLENLHLFLKFPEFMFVAVDYFSEDPDLILVLQFSFQGKRYAFLEVGANYVNGVVNVHYSVGLEFDVLG